MVGRKSGRAFRQIDAGIGGLRFAHPPYGDPRLDRRNTREERQRGAWKGRKYLRDSRSTGRLNWRHTKLLKGGLLHAKCQMGIDRRWRGDANRLRPAPPRRPRISSRWWNREPASSQPEAEQSTWPPCIMFST